MELTDLLALLAAFELQTRAVRGLPVEAVLLVLDGDGGCCLEAHLQVERHDQAELRNQLARGVDTEAIANFNSVGELIDCLKGKKEPEWVLRDE